MIFDMPTCGACRTCEIACSYHNTGEFKPSASSIKILDKKDETLGHLVLLIEYSDGQNIPCDGCKDLEEPLCMEVCQEKEKLHEMIKKYLGKVEPEKNVRRTA